MSAAQLSPEQRQAIDEVYAFAMLQLSRGVSPMGVENQLRGKGLEPRSAALVVRQLALAQNRGKAGKPVRGKSGAMDGAPPEGGSGASMSSRSGVRNMLGGGFFFLLGCGLTVVSIATAGPDGRIRFWPVMIIWGAIEFLYGVFQVMKGE